MNHEVLVLHVREVHSPYMDELRGYRVLVAVPNLQGHKFNGQRTVLFAKPYLVYESLDLTFDDVAKHSTELNARFKGCNFITADVVEMLARHAESMTVPHKERSTDNE